MTDDDVTIRPRRPDEGDAVLDVVRAAFGHDDDGRPEVDIVVRTWALGDAVRPIDLVALDGSGAPTGHVLGAAGTVGSTELLAVAPLGVVPPQQGRGVGSALMRELIGLADEAGWPAVVLLGNPAYYGRFGFEPAGSAGLVYRPVGPDSPHFQIRHLTAHAPSLVGDFVYCWEAWPGS